VAVVAVVELGESNARDVRGRFYDVAIIGWSLAWTVQYDRATTLKVTTHLLIDCYARTSQQCEFETFQNYSLL
jgi:hypothetical protein